MSEKAHAASGDDHGHGHGHGDVSPFIQHHYDDAQHQFDSGKFGIWLFLAQEVLFFSALFVAYVLYRYHHPEIYSYAHKYLDVKMGAINTAVLIFSSLTAAWAVRCAQLNQKKGMKNGSTALIVAAKGGHIDVVKLLLANRADPNKAVESGETAFDIALKNQNTDIAELLRKAGGKSGKTTSIEFK